jgi:hypothetical protein
MPHDASTWSSNNISWTWKVWHSSLYGYSHKMCIIIRGTPHCIKSGARSRNKCQCMPNVRHVSNISSLLMELKVDCHTWTHGFTSTICPVCVGTSCRSLDSWQYSNRLWAGRLEFDSWQKQIFFPLHSIKTDTGTHPASKPMDTRGSFPCNSPLTRSHDGTIRPLPHTSSWNLSSIGTTSSLPYVLNLMAKN